MVLTFINELELIRIAFKKHLGLTTWIHINASMVSPEIWIYKYNSDMHEWYYAGNLTYFKNVDIYDSNSFALHIKALIKQYSINIDMLPKINTKQLELSDKKYSLDDKPTMFNEDVLKDVFLSSFPKHDNELITMNTLETASYLHINNYPSWFVDEVCRRQLTYQTIRGLLNVIDMIRHIIIVDRNDNKELLERACRIALRYKHKPKSKPFWNMIMNSIYVKLALTSTFGNNTTVKQRKMLTRNAVEMLIAADRKLSIGDCFRKLNTRSCNDDNDDGVDKFEIIYNLCDILNSKLTTN